MADYDVYVTVAETTMATYRVRVNGSPRSTDAVASANAALRRDLDDQTGRFERVAAHSTRAQIITSNPVDLERMREETA